LIITVQNLWNAQEKFPYHSLSTTAEFLKLFFKWGPLSLVRMFYGPPYSWDYQTH